MPISLSAFDDQPLCHGHIWEVKDEAKLASLVARLMLGDFLHAEQILAGLDAPNVQISDRAIDTQIRRVTFETGADHERWHRDGWIFQLISWIAAVKASGDKFLVRAPQPRIADKGFDGLIVELRLSGESLGGVTICEDKATVDARRTVREEVWPDFGTIESGERDSELVSEVSVLLSQAGDRAMARTLIESIWWDEQRRYRISITVGEQHSGRDGRERLFAGYDACVPGECAKRRAETILVPELRSWMDSFCDQVRLSLQAMRGTRV